MAIRNQVPAFLTSSKLIITINGEVIAFAQNLSFTDDMMVQPVGGIGGINNYALEPTGYMGRGQMTITTYSDKTLNNITTEKAPGPLKDASVSDNKTYDGNSMLRHGFFNPLMILISSTFDIDVYERFFNEDGTFDEENKVSSVYDSQSIKLYTLESCRMNRYNIGFTPGSKVNETVGFICSGITDHRAELVVNKSFG